MAFESDTTWQFLPILPLFLTVYRFRVHTGEGRQTKDGKKEDHFRRVVHKSVHFLPATHSGLFKL